MLNIGAQLYGLTQRDLEGLPLEWFIRGASATIAAAGFSASLALPRPADDRLLYLHWINLRFTDLTGASRWTGLQLTLADPAAPAATIQTLWSGPGFGNVTGENQDAASNAATFNLPIMMVLPPRSQLTLSGTRSDTTSNAFVAASMFGLSIPVGTFGRGML